MTCECRHLMNVYAKCSDLCVITYRDNEREGYVPHGLGIGGGDYIEFKFCPLCGKMHSGGNLGKLTNDEVEDILKGK